MIESRRKTVIRRDFSKKLLSIVYTFQRRYTNVFVLKEVLSRDTKTHKGLCRSHGDRITHARTHTYEFAWWLSESCWKNTHTHNIYTHARIDRECIFFFTQCYSRGVFFIQFRRTLYFSHRHDREDDPSRLTPEPQPEYQKTAATTTQNLLSRLTFPLH